MNTFILQSLLLIAVAYFLGAVIGCWLRKIFQKSASMLHRESDELPVKAAIAVPMAVAVGAEAITTLAGSQEEASIKINRSQTWIEAEDQSVFVPLAVPDQPAPVQSEPVSYIEPLPVRDAKPVPDIHIGNIVEKLEPVTPLVPETVIEEIIAPIVPKPIIDDLTKIKGVGLPVALELKKLGITRFEHVANWSNADIAEISREFGFSGRIERENWMDQAKILATGDELEFTTHQLSETDGGVRPKPGASRTDNSLVQELESTLLPGATLASLLSAKGDDLQLVTGIGTNLEQKLNEMGISWFSQIAAWSDDDVVAISRQLDIHGRIELEDWIGQARRLGNLEA